MEKERKKILYLVTQSEIGGAQKYIYDLVRNLNQDFEIAVAYGEQGGQGELEQWLKNTQATTYSLPSLKRSISPLSDFSARNEIYDLLVRIKPDIIHLNSSKISILGSMAAKKYRRKVNPKAKVVYTVHGWVMREPLPVWVKKFYNWAERRYVSYKDKLILISQAELDWTVKHEIAPADKCQLIRHGIDPVNFIKRREARDFFRTDLECAIEKDDIVVYSIGNLYKTKGHKYLVEAAKYLKNQGIKLRYIIIGEGQLRNKLIHQINDLNLHRRFFLPGRLDGARYLKGADIYVCSSVKEGLSYTVMEAMQAGLPIIATEVGGNAELIQNEMSGLVVEPQNPEAIALAISKLLLDPALKTRLSQTAQRRAQTMFTMERMVKETKELYLDLINDK